MFQSIVIDVAGVFAGVAIALPDRFRFRAVDPRLDDLDATEWPSVAELRRVANAMMVRNGHVPRAAACG